jgi:hypothetical protein
MGKREKREDLQGQRFGKWTVLYNADKDLWCCQCDCGTTHNFVRGRNLRQGLSKSCGCEKNANNSPVREFGMADDEYKRTIRKRDEVEELRFIKYMLGEGD